VFNSVGVLQDDEVSPEKALTAVSADGLMRYFLVNAVVTPLIAKHAMPLLRGPRLSVFAALSARVGSIGDNRLGGWYGYRASKAALNMFVKTLSVEFSRRHNRCLFLALHPGTTRTPLAAPFIARTHYQVHEPQATAENLFSVVAGKTLAESGRFYAWDGQPIPW
jgi:NAD(P)-dependent dehydrogenase (short-subunit alcohol dehydrogenase family)